MEAGAPTQSQAQQLHLQQFSPENVAHNAKQLYYIRSVYTSVVGSAAGVFGLTNFDGFYFYLASVLIINIVIFAVNVHFQPRKYLLSFNPVKEPIAKDKKGASTTTETENSLAVAWRYISFLFEGAQDMAFGFVLWWTLWTAIIHIYE